MNFICLKIKYFSRCSHFYFIDSKEFYKMDQKRKKKGIRYIIIYISSSWEALYMHDSSSDRPVNFEGGLENQLRNPMVKRCWIIHLTKIPGKLHSSPSNVSLEYRDTHTFGGILAESMHNFTEDTCLASFHTWLTTLLLLYIYI